MEVQRLAGADNQLYFILLYTNLGASSTTLNAYALYCNIYIYIKAVWQMLFALFNNAICNYYYPTFIHSTTKTINNPTFTG